MKEILVLPGLLMLVIGAFLVANNLYLSAELILGLFLLIGGAVVTFIGIRRTFFR